MSVRNTRARAFTPDDTVLTKKTFINTLSPEELFMLFSSSAETFSKNSYRNTI